MTGPELKPESVDLSTSSDIDTDASPISEVDGPEEQGAEALKEEVIFKTVNMVVKKDLKSDSDELSSEYSETGERVGRNNERT